MHKDTKEALERLEAELLDETPELTDEELDALVEFYLAEDEGAYADPPVYQNYANGYRSHNTDQADVDLDEYADEIYDDPDAPTPGSLFLPLFSITVSAAALVFMLLRLL